MTNYFRKQTKLSKKSKEFGKRIKKF